MGLRRDSGGTDVSEKPGFAVLSNTIPMGFTWDSRSQGEPVQPTPPFKRGRGRDAGFDGVGLGGATVGIVGLIYDTDGEWCA